MRRWLSPGILLHDFLLSSTTVTPRQDAGDRIGTTPGVCTELCVYRCTYISLYTDKGVAALRNGIIVGACRSSRPNSLLRFDDCNLSRRVRLKSDIREGVALDGRNRYVSYHKFSREKKLYVSAIVFF